jgi:hypothetical protein
MMFRKPAVVLLIAMIGLSCATARMRLDKQLSLFIQDKPIKGRILVLDAALNRDIGIDDVQITEPNQLARVQIRWQNLTGRDARFEYSVRWTANDVPQEGTGQSWLPGFVTRRDTLVIQFTAPNQQAKFFELALKLPGREQ